MKIKDGFILRQVAGNAVVISVGALNFDGIIKLNDSGVLIWKLLEKGATKAEILSAFLEEYDVSKEQANEDIEIFLNRLHSAKLIDE